MNKKVTIKDIARELNIAYSTVSRALNNKGGVSPGKCMVILNKAKELGYEPNLNARQLRSGNSNIIGLIVPTINRDFFSSVINGVETEGRSKGYNVIICQSNESMHGEADSIEALLKNNVAGILMSISKETDKPGKHREILSRNIPFVMFDRVFSNFNVNKVVNDNFQGAFSVTEHMIQQGYSDILHLTGPLSINIYKERSEGYKKAILVNGLPLRKENIIENVLTREQGYREIQARLESGPPFDAIFSASDLSAQGAMLCLRDVGMKVPEQVGVAGYANELFTELLQMTTVDQHSTEMGKSAARLLFEEIDEGPVEQLKKEVIIKPELIIRQSTLKNKA